MRTKKLIAVAMSTVFISSALAYPASATGQTVLPFNAQEGNTSGVIIHACEDYVQVQLPSTMADDPHTGNPYASAAIPAQPYELFYREQTWYVDNGAGTTVFSSRQNLGSRDFPSVMETLSFTSTQPVGSELALSFSSMGNDGNSVAPESSSFSISGIEVKTASSLSGSGTEQDPYLIADADDLDLMRCDLDAHYELVSDIDMTGFDWMPISP